MTEEEIIVRLTLGNINDEIALKNICEAQGAKLDDLTEREKEFLIDTNTFYSSEAEYNQLHHVEDQGEFKEQVKEGIIVKTKDGYVWKNCV